ncbi:MAG: hypothetical protein HN856_16735 [Gammaproteobacteria bacterium]|jgi:Bax protein|nr:hypothetical protein [Gammaproteobacteria bacterium]
MNTSTPNDNKRPTRDTTRSQLTVTLLSMAILVVVITYVISLQKTPLPDFSLLEVKAKKQAFFDFLMPRIDIANKTITEERRHLQLISRKIPKETLTWSDQQFLKKLANDYDVTVANPPDYAALVTQLGPRVDTLPPALILAQAAKESGWGSSRFARQGNNLFGQQCFKKGCGFTPKGRAPGRTHEVAKFVSVQAAVDAYLHNINTHRSYQLLREQRATMRAAEVPLSGIALAGGLQAYSERGDEYIAEIQSLIRFNKLE